MSQGTTMRGLCRRSLAAVAALLLLAACRKEQGSAGIASGSGERAGYFTFSQAKPPSAPSEAKAPAQGGGNQKGNPRERDVGRKLIRNGEVSIEVRDFDVAARKSAEIAKSFGGYVADSQAAGEGRHRHGSLTIRVPASRFDEALAGLRALGKIQSEHIGVEDITKAYTDLEARLRVKRDSAERVREILRNRTARLADVLEAERQLTALVEQIEVMEGEKRFYDQQVAFSTIKAELHEPEAIVRPTAFTPLRDAFRDSLYNLSASLAAFLTGILYVAPWAGLVFLLLVVLRRIRRGRKS